jgi:hypothetical protein
MEVNRAESAAVAAVGGVPADVLDMAGRLVVSPNALTLDGQRNVPADLQPGESLATFLERHVPGIRSGAWTVMIGGAMVPQAMWARTYPKHGQLIACRAVLRKSALQLVAIAALTYFWRHRRHLRRPRWDVCFGCADVPFAIQLACSWPARC